MINPLLEQCLDFHWGRLNDPAEVSIYPLSMAEGVPFGVGVQGFIQPFEDGTFEIFIDTTLPLVLQLLVLCHELVHVKQSMSGIQFKGTIDNYTDFEIETNGLMGPWLRDFLYNTGNMPLLETKVTFGDVL